MQSAKTINNLPPILLYAKSIIERISWGCGAGKHVIGILHNEDIVACTSIRDKTLVAGNIREKSLKSIWESPDSFKWNRNFDSSKLKGFCRECRYTERCLGGCSNSRYCING